MYGKIYYGIRNWVINLRGADRTAPADATAKSNPDDVIPADAGAKREPAAAISKPILADRPSALGEPSVTKKDNPYAFSTLPKGTGNSHAAA